MESIERESGEQKAIEKASVEQTPAEQAGVEQTPAEQAGIEQTPAEQAGVEQTSAEQAPEEPATEEQEYNHFSRYAANEPYYEKSDVTAHPASEGKIFRWICILAALAAAAVAIFAIVSILRNRTSGGGTSAGMNQGYSGFAGTEFSAGQEASGSEGFAGQEASGSEGLAGQEASRAEGLAGQEASGTGVFDVQGTESAEDPEEQEAAGATGIYDSENPGLAGVAVDMARAKAEEDTEEEMTEPELTALVKIGDETQEEIDFEPHAVESTKPENMIELTGIEINGEVLSEGAKYNAPASIGFGLPGDYTQADGIFTFRGDNFRNSPAAGCAEITENIISQEWSRQTGSTTFQGASWTGSGWTGQPLMRRWTREEKVHMNMEDWAKEKDDLVEVIYACMDGYIYFLDLVTGEPTREPMYIGWTFKGSGALDPRGYPLLYLGAGYDSNLGVAHAFIISLTDCTILYEFGGVDSFSLRGTVGFFDSSPLVDAETDMLIWPGENGVIYMIHLNSSWDPAAGTMTIAPGNMVKWHYKGLRSGTIHDSKYWLGIEDSYAAYHGYLFATDNGGHLMCLDLNTLELVWVQDTLDDSNSTPVLSIEDGHLYLYTSTSFRLGWRSNTTAPVPIWKIDAETGEKIWEKEYECSTMDGVSGGVQSSMALGKHKLSGYLYATVAMTGGPLQGVCVCLDRDTGEVVWEHKAYYAWSSPVLVYDRDGSGKLIYCSCAGKMYMLDPLTGEELAVSELSNGAIEASPAVWNNYVVIGTRACKIWGLKLS